MDIPETILEAVREATARHMGSVETAIAVAIEAVRCLDDFDDAVTVLVNHAVQGLVYDARSSLTAAVSRQAAYTGAPKVNVARSAAVNRVAMSVYNHAIGGTRLGDLRGEELDAIAATEREIAKGHNFNAELLGWCRAQGVADGQRVRDVIPEAKLRSAYNRLRGRKPKVAVAA